jgi:hypothetical protein
MSEERRKVLEMLAAGKISAEQADKLAGGGANQSNASESQAASTPSGASKPKYLRIVVDSPGRDPVNVRVPISLAGSARRLLAVMPLQVSERLAEHGIDAGFFSGAKGENLDEMMRELNIDVEEGKGKKVRIFCE